MVYTHLGYRCIKCDFLMNLHYKVIALTELHDVYLFSSLKGGSVWLVV